jgi:hypothetical protein
MWSIAVDRGMTIGDTRPLEKAGMSGRYVAP